MNHIPAAPVKKMFFPSLTTISNTHFWPSLKRLVFRNLPGSRKQDTTAKNSYQFFSDCLGGCRSCFQPIRAPLRMRGSTRNGRERLSVVGKAPTSKSTQKQFHGLKTASARQKWEEGGDAWMHIPQKKLRGGSVKRTFSKEGIKTGSFARQE